MARTHVATVSAKKSGKTAARKVKHMLITPVDNGFKTEVHYHPQSDAEKDQPYNMAPSEQAHSGASANNSMINSVKSAFPKEAAAAPAVPAAGAPPAGGEPDGDEEE